MQEHHEQIKPRGNRPEGGAIAFPYKVNSLLLLLNITQCYNYTCWITEFNKEHTLIKWSALHLPI